MKYSWKKRGCFLIALALLSGIVIYAPAKVCLQAKSAVTCKSICSAVLKTTGGAKKLKYTSTSALDFGALSASERSKVKSIQYICDAREVYSLCVIQAKSTAGAKKLAKCLKKYKKNNCSSDYLSDYSKTERKVFKNSVYGRKGKYVWYIALSPKKEKNKKGQTALKRNFR